MKEKDIRKKIKMKHFGVIIILIYYCAPKKKQKCKKKQGKEFFKILSEHSTLWS